MDNNPFGPMLPQGWQHWDNFWWKPAPEWKVDKEMRFPFYTDNVDRFSRQHGYANGGFLGKINAQSFYNPGSELSPPFGTMLLPNNPPQQLVNHENHHFDGYLHPDTPDEWSYRSMLEKLGIKY